VPFILVNSREPVVRQRFTLAHEYGHHRLGHGSVCDERIWWGATDPREAAANRFAAEFLVPVAGVDLWFHAERPHPVGVETLVRLATAFGVSCEVALWRAKAAGRVTATAADRLKKRLEANEHHGLRSRLGLSEIVDTISASQNLEVRVPARMSGNVLKALEFGIITADQAAEKLHMTTAQLQAELERRSRALDDE
jgi:Zn-dependent peptidase ImmA (M78 family)